MELFIRNEYGEYVPFDSDLYEHQIREQVYQSARKRNRQKKKLLKERKIRKVIGATLIIITIIVCKLFLSMGENDITFAVILLPLATTIFFSND